jgi:hypothetical protein
MDASLFRLRGVVGAAREDVGRPRLGELLHHADFVDRLFGGDELLAGDAQGCGGFARRGVVGGEIEFAQHGFVRQIAGRVCILDVGV